MRRLAAFAALVVVTLSWATPARAASAGAVGWWTRSPVASAPEGGFTVGNAPDGPLSVAAIELDLGDTGVSSGTVSFEQAGGTAPAAGRLVACVIGGGFAPSAGDPIEEAPATTCDATSAPAQANGTTWTVNIADLVADRSGTVGLALVPATGSTGLWDLQLDRPTLTATPARSSSSGGTTATTMRTTPTTARAPAASSSGASTFAVPKPPSVSQPTATTAAPATTVAPTTTVVSNLTAAAETTFSGEAGGGSEGRPVGQAVSLVLVAAVVGVIGGVVHKVGGNRFAA